jgi:hypothetical protein
LQHRTDIHSGAHLRTITNLDAQVEAKFGGQFFRERYEVAQFHPKNPINDFNVLM